MRLIDSELDVDGYKKTELLKSMSYCDTIEF